jgi:3-oxoacid CoA-transferase B subunit
VTRERWNRDEMAAAIALLLEAPAHVNLGIGIPTLVSSFITPGSGILLSSENGVIGYGMIAPAEIADRDIVNAGVQAVTLNPGAAIVNHAESFAMIRRGLIDVTVLGAYEVASDGSFANWKAKNDDWPQLGGTGGAMDLAVAAQRVILALEHTTGEGAPRLVERCVLPVTALGVVDTVVTNVGVFRPRGPAFELQTAAPGWDLASIQAITGAPVVAAEGAR